jgi:hypothetical protein
MNALCAAVILGTLITASTTVAATTVVYPTEQYPADVLNVQAALDQGGTVLLKATNVSGTPTPFNFGPPTLGPGFVTFHRDAELTGEHLSGAATTIAGGFYPLRGFDPIRTAVRDITFDAPLHGAIFFEGPPEAETEITRNQISHVVGRLFPGFGTVGEAMVVGGGRVVINDNIVDSVDADLGIGITELDSTGAVEILRNRVAGTSSSAIECTRNHGVVRIEDNIVRPGPTVDGFGGTGIEVNGTGAYIVFWNDVLIETPGGIGIFVLGAMGFGFGPVTGAVIQSNNVVMQPVGDIDGSLFNDGIDLAGLVSGTYVGLNKVEGPGFSAFSLFDASFDPADPSDLGFNTYVGNNIADVSADVADVVLFDATHDTVLKGMSGSVIDLGTNNHIAGFTKGVGPMTGLQVSKAIHLRNRALGAARDPGPP